MTCVTCMKRRRLLKFQRRCSGAKVNCHLNTGELSAGDPPSLGENNSLPRKNAHTFLAFYVPRMQPCMRFPANKACKIHAGIDYGNHFNIIFRNVNRKFSDIRFPSFFSGILRPSISAIPICREFFLCIFLINLLTFSVYCSKLVLNYCDRPTATIIFFASLRTIFMLRLIH